MLRDLAGLGHVVPVPALTLARTDGRPLGRIRFHSVVPTAGCPQVRDLALVTGRIPALSDHMPKKRRSNPRRPQPRHSGHPGRRGQILRPEVDLPILQATDAAEARGDVFTALHLIQNDLATRSGTGTGFWRPERLRRLCQLALFGPVLPGWVTSRWILAQACQHLDPRRRGVGLKAIDIAVETRGGVETLRGHDQMDAAAKVMDHDWVCRQLLLYELGALRNFVSRGAAPDLLAGADHIEEWMCTPMGGFRLVEETPTSLRLLDLGSGEEVEVLNIGAAALLALDECAIGRLVPIQGGAMFETAPLYVPDYVAERVAADPSGWVDAVATGCQEARARGDLMPTERAEFGMVTDVPSFVRIGSALRLQEERSGCPSTGLWTTEVAERAQVGLIRAALDEHPWETGWGVSPWPVVGAALMEPGVSEALEQTLTSVDEPGLLRLADRLAGPAGGWCHELAMDVRDAA